MEIRWFLEIYAIRTWDRAIPFLQPYILVWLIKKHWLEYSQDSQGSQEYSTTKNGFQRKIQK